MPRYSVALIAAVLLCTAIGLIAWWAQRSALVAQQEHVRILQEFEERIGRPQQFNSRETNPELLFPAGFGQGTIFKFKAAQWLTEKWFLWITAVFAVCLGIEWMIRRAAQGD